MFDIRIVYDREIALIAGEETIEMKEDALKMDTVTQDKATVLLREGSIANHVHRQLIVKPELYSLLKRFVLRFHTVAYF